MKSLKTLLTGLALLGTLSLALLAPSAASASSRVAYKDTSTCAHARVGHVSCLAIRRTVFVNGIRQHALTPMTGTTFGAPALRKAYGISAQGIRSKVIAIVDAEHSGTAYTDLTAYRRMYGIQDIANCGTDGEA
ncbi:MAG: hypothetical protein KGL72_06780, partial [Actinomycetales bacterium]|nr:hypothetical protein [Actinomycetales bacterium]